MLAAALAARRIEAARQSLASADWFEDPEAIRPDEWLTLGARPEEIRAAYARYGAHFGWTGTGDLPCGWSWTWAQTSVAIRHNIPH
jgi:hypothetical protein